LTLHDYEEEILRRMYDTQIIGMDYVSVQKVRSKIHWIDLQSKYNIRKSFHSIMRRLEAKGYVDDHGKSGAVYSLSQDGVHYVFDKFVGKTNG
jgi:hypothetical protein